METICILRNIFKALRDFEESFTRMYGVCLNEAMALCCLSDRQCSSTEIAEKTGMSASHTSKVIGALEKKKLIKRILGERDKRQMYFRLTESGRERLVWIQKEEIIIPDILKPVFENK